MSIEFTPSALEQIANCMVRDEVTHRILDGKFAELHIQEQIPLEPEYARRYGLRAGVDYYVKQPSKRDRLLLATQITYQRSGGNGVLQLIQTLYSPVT